MRSKLVLLSFVVVTACKGDERQDGKASPPAQANVKEAVPLPAGFPLPASPNRRLVRFYAERALELIANPARR